MGFHRLANTDHQVDFSAEVLKPSILHEITAVEPPKAHIEEPARAAIPPLVLSSCGVALRGMSPLPSA